MIKSIQTMFRIPELKSRILFTLGILIVYRIGGHVPVPGINAQALFEFFEGTQGGLFDLWDMFAGGAFKQATVFALGIMPYISASIIIQLLGAVVPYFQKLQKEGEEGRKKITQLTRYGTVGISLMQAYGLAIFLQNIGPSSVSGELVVPHQGFAFIVRTMITMSAGCVLIMWLGEQITERGIGNGISLIIFVGIIARFPNALFSEAVQVASGNHEPLVALILLGLMVFVIGFTVWLTQGTRKIPVQYAKRVVGRKIYGGQSTHIPLKVNTAGVMPIIFAQSIMFVPSTIKTFFPNSEFVATIVGYFDYSHPVYWAVYGTLIVFFTYFYTAIALNPVDVADNMKKYGGFIPGVRPGKRTSEYIDNILTRVTLPGSILLAVIAILPYIINKVTKVNFQLAAFFGGTSLLIIVGVALDTLQQIESHMMMRHYDGFMKSGKVKGRR